METERLRVSVGEMDQRFAALSQYALFNSYQARMAAFGNESAIRALFIEMQAAQKACTAAFQSPAADALVGSRALRLIWSFPALARQLVEMQERAARDRNGITISFLLKLRAELLTSKRPPALDRTLAEKPPLPLIAALEQARADTYQECWGDFATTPGHEFLLAQLQRGYSDCKAIHAHPVAAHNVSASAATLAERIRHLYVGLTGQEPVATGTPSVPVPVPV